MLSASFKHKAKLQATGGRRSRAIEKRLSKSLKEKKFKIYAIPKTTNIRLFTVNENSPENLYGRPNLSLIYFFVSHGSIFEAKF